MTFVLFLFVPHLHLLQLFYAFMSIVSFVTFVFLLFVSHLSHVWSLGKAVLHNCDISWVSSYICFFPR